MKRKPIVILLMDRYFAGIHKAISDYAVQAGWMLDATMAVASERYETPQADAILAVYTITKKTRDWLRKHDKTPTVHVWMSAADIQQGWSGTVERGQQTGSMAADYYLKLGFTHFAFYQRFEGSRSEERWEGYQATLKEEGFTPVLLRPQKTVGDSTTWLSRQLLKMPKPLALFVQDDLRGAESIHACHAAGLSIPDDVAIIGVGNDELMTHSCGVPLSSVDVQMRQLAVSACDLLKKRLARGLRRQEVVWVEPLGVIPRQSSDSRAVASAFVMRVIQFIRANLHRPIESDDVALALHCSRRWLDSECQRLLNHTCFDELVIQRMHRAKQLLADTDFPMASVAMQVGMPHLPRFFRQFKATIRQTPAAYRKSCR